MGILHRIYVAGPLGLPDVIGWDKVNENIKVAEAAGMALSKQGVWSPFVPHSNARWPDAFTDIDHDTWVGIDEAWIEVCEFLIRLPGYSTGSDREVRFAIKYKIPVLTLDMALHIGRELQNLESDSSHYKVVRAVFDFYRNQKFEDVMV